MLQYCTAANRRPQSRTGREERKRLRSTDQSPYQRLRFSTVNTIATRCGALAGWPAIFAQGEQRRLRLGRPCLGAAQHHQIAPQIAAAVDLDEACRAMVSMPPVNTRPAAKSPRW